MQPIGFAFAVRRFCVMLFDNRSCFCCCKVLIRGINTKQTSTHREISTQTHDMSGKNEWFCELPFEPFIALICHSCRVIWAVACSICICSGFVYCYWIGWIFGCVATYSVRCNLNACQTKSMWIKSMRHTHTPSNAHTRTETIRINYWSFDFLCQLSIDLFHAIWKNLNAIFFSFHWSLSTISSSNSHIETWLKPSQNTLKRIHYIRIYLFHTHAKKNSSKNEHRLHDPQPIFIS